MMMHQRGPAYASRGGRDDISPGTYVHASSLADTERTPVGIWHRDGWHVISDVAPDIDEDDTREADGWELVAVIDHDTYPPGRRS